MLAAVYRQLSDPAAERHGPRRAGGEGRQTPAPPTSADGARRGRQRLEGPGQGRAAPPGGESADPGPVSAARPSVRAAGRADEAMTAYRAVALLDDSDPADVHYRLAEAPAARPGSATRPGARSSSRSRKPLASSTRIGSCSNWSNPAKNAATPPTPRRLEALDHDTKTIDPARDPAARWRSPSGVAVAQYRRFRGRPGHDPRGPAPGVPNWTVDERFKHDVFTFVRVEYDSRRRPCSSDGRSVAWAGSAGPRGWRPQVRRRRRWATDYPDSDLNFSYRLQQLTSLKVNPDPISPAA